MSPPGRKYKTLYFTPIYIDDIEIAAPCMYLESLRRGHDVLEVLMTNSESGTYRDDFKGNRLKRLRMREMKNANRVFEGDTQESLRIVAMGYPDGHLPSNRQAEEEKRSPGVG